MFDELVCKVRPSSSQARGLQVGNGTDPVSARFHGDQADVPPGRLRLCELGLLLAKLFPVRNPSRNKSRKLIGWHDADSVEVEVAAIPFRRLRVEDVGSLHAELAFEKVGDFGLFKICAQRMFERRAKFVVGEMTDGKQILLHPNGIPDAKSLFRR